VNDERRTYRAPDPARMAEFTATARRLQHERESAAEVVQRLLRETPKNEWPWLARRTELHTNGALEELGKRINALIDREPREVLVIAEVASIIADSIADDAYPSVVLAQMRAQAWSDRARALDYLARYDEALAALDRAAEYLKPFATLAHDLATVGYVRATTLQNLNRYDESLRLLSTCRETFRDHGDVRRQLICGFAAAMLQFRLHLFEEARATCAPLLATASELNDADSLACVHNLLAFSAMELDDFSSSEQHFNRAIQLFTQLDQPVHVLRAQDGRGRIMIRRGEYDRAIQHLEVVRNDFLAHGLTEEAGISGLGVVESLLALGAAAEAEALARTLVTEFTDASLNARAVAALRVLSEAVAARRASRATVAIIREYIHSLRTDPEREFTAVV
jgi:tetratricopeptide (TPR) repeat protein